MRTEETINKVQPCTPWTRRDQKPIQSLESIKSDSKRCKAVGRTCISLYCVKNVVWENALQPSFDEMEISDSPVVHELQGVEIIRVSVS